jgi:threonine dehydrogenase-like Zn-dependent dehydrogenase
MRAYVQNAPGEGGVQEVSAAVAAPGEVVIDVERVGVCGTGPWARVQLRA